MKRIYLCGPITGLSYEGATEERNRIRDIFKEHGVEALTPMRGKLFQLEGRDATIAQKGYEETLLTDRAIVYRDRNDVKTSDCILADLRGATRVSIGSMVEYGWADAFRIPIITVMEKSGNLHDHGFVHQLSTYVVTDMEEAIDLSLILLNA
jgi:nucleoside 2-deoxyribosyltransferase